ncbi:MAG: hypothetical protein ABJE47_21445 [bacterium]
MRITGSRYPSTAPVGSLRAPSAALPSLRRHCPVLALAFHLGSQDGYTVPLTFLLGYPTNLLLRFIPGFALSSAGPASVEPQSPSDRSCQRPATDHATPAALH